MDHSTIEVRLLPIAVEIAKSAQNLHLTASICKAIRAASDRDQVCAFSDIANTVNDQLARIQRAAKKMQQDLGLQDHTDDAEALTYLEHKREIETIADQIADFACLADCQIESTVLEPVNVCKYFALRLLTFAEALKAEAVALGAPSEQWATA